MVPGYRQVEGGLTHSNWADFEEANNLTSAGASAEEWDRFDEDLQLMKEPPAPCTSEAPPIPIAARVLQ